MATTRRARSSWHWLLTIIAWISAIGVGCVIVAFLAGASVRVYRSLSGPTDTSTVQKNTDCSPSSAVPCTEREARLALQAKVDSGTVPVHLTTTENIAKLDAYSAQVIEANTAKVKADAEKEKARWEQERYQELQRELQAQGSASTPRQTGAISCDSSAWARSTCDRLMR